MTNDKKLLTLVYISKFGVDTKNILSNDSQVTIMAWEIDTKTCTFNDYIGD